jgi:hypothetical protein
MLPIGDAKTLKGIPVTDTPEDGEVLVYAFAAGGYIHQTVEATSIGAHADSHKSGGTDEIDADKVDIDFDPAGYTPSVVTGITTSRYQLTSHLNGIDATLVTLANTLDIDCGGFA